MSGIDRQYMHPGYKKNYPIRTVLRDLAGQEGCDGEPYDAMQFAADTIDELEKALAAAEARVADLEASCGQALTQADKAAIEWHRKAEAAEAREAKLRAALRNIGATFPRLPSGLTDFGERHHYLHLACRLRDHARAALTDKGDTDNDG